MESSKKSKPLIASLASRLESPNTGWKLSRVVQMNTDSGRRSVEAANTIDKVPTFLSGPEFEVLDFIEARPSSERRTTNGTGSSNLPLTATIPADASVLLVIRQESGAISFQRPNVIFSTRRDSGETGEAQVTFDVPVLAGDPDTRRRGVLSNVVRVVLVKVAKKLIGTVVQHAAEWAVPRLASALEAKLWKNRSEGWMRVTRESLSTDSLTAGVPSFPAQERGVLLLHGIFSHTTGTFGDLAKEAFFDEVRKIYGSNVHAFNHFSFSKTPEENVKDLLDSLPDRDFQFDVVCHSRGGLLIRELLEGSGRAHPKRNRLKIGKVVFVATPNIGSPLTSPANWERKLSWLANIIEMFPDNPFSTAGAWLTEALGWFAENIAGNTPGFVAMDPEGDFILNLQDPPDAPADTAYYALTTNFHPSREWWSRLADMGVDSFFGGANDLAVWTEGVWKTSNIMSGWVPASRIGCFGPGGNLCPENPGAVNHLNFFKHPQTATFILAVLKGEALSLPEINPQVQMDSRSILTRRGVFSASVPGVIKANDSEPRMDAQVSPAKESINFVLTSGWDLEDELSLTVVSHFQHSKVEEESSVSVPLLIAKYGTARVTVPFYTKGEEDNAGKRWRGIIDKQNLIVDYANGKEVSFSSKNTTTDFPSMDFLKEFGDQLFQTLFPREVRNLYNVARFRHKNRQLKIIFSSMIPWVADFPWEFAFDATTKSFLTTGDVRFVRNVLTPTPANKIEEKNRALRILVVSAQPSNFGNLSIEDEQTGIYESFRPLIDAGLVEVDVLAGATASMLHERLRYQPDSEEFDVLHFIGHGEFDEESKTGFLFFQNDLGQAQKLSASNFLDIVRSRGIRIVFLNACETGRGGKAYYNQGVAMALVEDGIPAVVANQYSVIDRSASLFSLHFYACLAQGLKLGDAMREARIALQYCGVEPMDWGVPVLFANNPDARLCTPPVRSGTTKGPSRSDFNILSRMANVSRRTGGPRRKTVSVWDAENSLVYRENLGSTLQELNEAQNRIAFQLERFSAPRNFWTVDPNPSSDGVAYLRAEKVISRMERIRQSIGTDFLFCVTSLPLRDEQTTALYYVPENKIIILSIWSLNPPLEGLLLKQAVANHLAMALLEGLSEVYSGGETVESSNPIHTVGYYNEERSVAHITGRMTLTKDTKKRIQQKIKTGTFSGDDYEAILKLFDLYQPQIDR